VAYLGICVAAPLFLRRVHALTTKALVIGVLGTLAAAAMIVGQLVPIPPNPVDLLLLGFAAWLVLGALVFAVQRSSATGGMLAAGATTEENVARTGAT